MRIALVTTSFLPKIGGAEFAIHHLAQQWCRQGHEVFVVNNCSDRAVEPDAHYEVRRFPLLRGTTRFGYHRYPFAWYERRKLSQVLRQIRPDLVSAHYGYPVAIWLSRLKPVPPFLITCHGPALDETPNGPRQRWGVGPLLAESMNAARSVVAISTFARRILERIGVDPRRIVDIPNGADLERFWKPVTDFDLRAELGLPAQATVALSVGRETWEKGYEGGIRAFARVARRVPEAYYIVLGRGTDRWQPLADELGVRDRVVFCSGLYDDALVGAYQQADVFFMPSVQELCPLVAVEAMAAGLPEMVTDVGGCQDMVTHGHNGLIAPPGDVEAMASGLESLLVDARLRDRMGRASRERSRHYGWDSISRLYLEQRSLSLEDHPGELDTAPLPSTSGNGR